MCQAQDLTIPLWNDSVPNQRKTSEQEIATKTDILRIGNVQTPTLACYFPPDSINTRKAIIICPGGSYKILAYNLEGTTIAKWFQERGIAAFVLKYRLPTSSSLVTPHKAPLQDLQKAVRLVRHKAADWQISENDIGVMGFSAGGHLASTLGVHYHEEMYQPRVLEDSLSARPDFMALLYPVITMNATYAHKGSIHNLLGDSPSQTLLDYYSNEQYVNSQTPPTFLVHATDDRGVPVENTLAFYQRLKEVGVPVEMHLYQEGGHGFGIAANNKLLHTWIDLLYNWILNIDNQ
ncbi:alpha/beta hydrolase [Snuella sp. CAU 1569]|uniref:Alpha/beta hydrolase n=2 Tax=Snuella sedimenti TaxID=2798802 RepID=A0A8J7IY49_9FLAO|nr:alpha/beta hydrolase [Snuella sedimenti]